jgi:uncharacterized cupin superfamily protein
MEASQIAPSVWQLDHSGGEQPYMAIWQCTSQCRVKFFDQVEDAKGFAYHGRTEDN